MSLNIRNIYIGILQMSALLATTPLPPPSNPMTVLFPSQEQLEKALQPYTLEELNARIAASSLPLIFECHSDIGETNIKPLRVKPYDLLTHSVWQSNELTVQYPSTPRVPHHLTISLKRSDIRGISAITAEENRALFETVHKIAEIYKSIGIHGFVMAQFDTPQLGHQDRYTVEVIPHLPGFHPVKNIADKVDCNRYVLFRSANLSPAEYSLSGETISQHVAFWQNTFQKETLPLSQEETSVTFPYCRFESHEQEAQDILKQHLLELLQDRGAHASPSGPSPIPMPTEPAKEPHAISAAQCAFCNSEILNRQTVFEYEGIQVLYNIRKGATPGCNFLILPTIHKQKIYTLSQEEIDQIRLVRQALVEVLKETHPGHEVIVYIQDDPSVGQTVYHTHEQVVAVDPQNLPFYWTLMCLFPNGNVSNEEMREVTSAFREKMERKIGDLQQAS